MKRPFGSGLTGGGCTRSPCWMTYSMCADSDFVSRQVMARFSLLNALRNLSPTRSMMVRKSSELAMPS